MLNILRGTYDSVDRNGLHKVELVRPERAGNRWAGIQHGKLVDSLILNFEKLFSLHPVPESETYGVSPSGTEMIGGFSLGTKVGNKISPLYLGGIPQETYQSVGFQHSNDCRKALRIYCGGTVTLCSNGLVTAAYSFRHKHTSRLSLVEWMSGGLENVWSKFSRTGEYVEALNDHSVRPVEHDRMLLQLSRSGTIPWRLLGEVDTCWKTACDGEEVPWSPEWEWNFNSTAWDWYNAVTHVAKKIPPANQFPTLENAFTITCTMLPKKDRPDIDADRLEILNPPE